MSCLKRVINDSHRIRRGNPSSKCQLKLIKVFKRRGQYALTFISAFALRILGLTDTYLHFKILSVYICLYYEYVFRDAFGKVNIVCFVFRHWSNKMCGCFESQMFHQHAMSMVMDRNLETECVISIPMQIRGCCGRIARWCGWYPALHGHGRLCII